MADPADPPPPPPGPSAAGGRTAAEPAVEAPILKVADAIGALNTLPCPVLAVDLPSGLNADTGQYAIDSVASGGCSALGTWHIHAKNTLCLLSCKPGLFTAHGRDAAGTVWFDDLGVDGTAEPADAWMDFDALTLGPYERRDIRGRLRRDDDVEVADGLAEAPQAPAVLRVLHAREGANLADEALRERERDRERRALLTAVALEPL